MFRPREIFNILVSENILIHGELRNKGKLTREFDTGYIVVLRKQVGSRIKDGISHILLFKKKGTL